MFMNIQKHSWTFKNIHEHSKNIHEHSKNIHEHSKNIHEHSMGTVRFFGGSLTTDHGSPKVADQRWVYVWIHVLVVLTWLPGTESPAYCHAPSCAQNDENMVSGAKGRVNDKTVLYRVVASTIESRPAVVNRHFYNFYVLPRHTQTGLKTHAKSYWPQEWTCESSANGRDLPEIPFTHNGQQLRRIHALIWVQRGVGWLESCSQ